MYKKIISVALIALLVVPMLSRSEDKKTPAIAPDFSLETHDGKKLTLSKLKGKRGVVLVFFATWCPACMNEVPEVKKFVTASKDKNILVYGVNIKQSKRIVKKFAKDHKINYRVLLDKDGVVAGKYKVRGIPLIVGIDGNGVIQYRKHSIPHDADALVKKLTVGIK